MPAMLIEGLPGGGRLKIKAEENAPPTPQVVICGPGPHVDEGNPFQAHIGNLPNQALAVGATVNGGIAVQANIGNVTGQALAATIDGPLGQPIKASVDATVYGGTAVQANLGNVAGQALAATVDATVHGGGAPIQLDAVRLAPITLGLQPGITITFFLLGLQWLRLFSIEVKGSANLS